MATLVDSETWKKIDGAQQKQILADEGIDGLPDLSVGSESDLIGTLEQTPLPAWKTKTDALIQQFARAAIAAAKLLEPKTQRITLPSGTLRNDDELKAWLDKVEKQIREKLKDGPVIV